ncbi:MAG: chitobiase/beta-hexosaminidase C-terminal domain-containing protein [Maribacter sp.]
MLILTIQIGHFHPLLVHLPIGIILLAFALEIYGHFKPKLSINEIVSFTLAAAAVTALFSLGTGWLLGEEGGFDEDLLFLHRWMAVAFTVTTMVLFFLKRSESIVAQKLYIPVFVIVLILIAATGHYGGNMTHGEDYLFRDTAPDDIIIKDVAEAQVHAEIVQPILNAKCVSCHNKGKIKGGLLMTTAQDLEKGGDSGSVFDSIDGKPLLVHRIHLPVEDEEHMPPKGKVQLTPEEITLLEWWITNDHCLNCKTKDLNTSEKLELILASLEEDDSPRAMIAKEVDAVPESWLAELKTFGITAYPLEEGNPLLIASLFGEKEELEEKLELLDTHAENIVELNLGNSAMNDTLSEWIGRFENLTKLQLQNTRITDESVAIFKELPYLESLNLYGTAISDQIFEIAEKMTGLKSLYLYQTQVTPTTTERFQSDFPDIAVQHIPKDAFKSVTLSAPTIVAVTTFFKDSLQIALENTFEESKIFYTLDGTLPDSTALSYKGPFTIKESTTVSAMVFKEGWKSSEVNTQSFKTTAVDYAEVSLNTPPNEKYKGQFGKTLVDLKRGSTNFVDGNWLGYEGSHFSTTLTLKEPKEISTVSVGALSAPTSWIFYPVGLQVYVSDNGKQFKRIKSLQFPKEEPNNSVALKFFDIEIPPTQAKYVKVEIRSPLKNPSWHPNPGGKSWIFIDEIILN